MKRALKKTVCVILLLSLVLGYIPATAISIPVRQEKSIQLQTETIVIPGAMDPDQRIRTVKTTTQQVDYAPLAEVEYLTDYAEAGAIMRKTMKNREATVSIPIEINFDESLEDAVEAILSHAVAHTGDPTEGDYLDKQRGQISAEATYYPDSDEFQFVINFTLTYYTTAQQEAQVDAAVADLLESLHLDGKTDYEKVSAVYDWMCANITYDYEHLNDPSYTLMYTAYAALIDHTSVCQGYATLLYRMMLELGIDCRVITGIANGGGHAWNIVEVGGLYYNADATWDASWYQAGAGYNFFLRADDTFEDHTRDVNFDNVWFREEYPMTRTDFNINAACVHNYISVVLDPSCTEQGYTTRTCEYCGDSYTEYYKDAYGHAFWDWITAVEPTETTYGRQYRECWHCGLIEEKEILLVPELVNTMIFSTDGIAYLYGEYGQLMNTYTGWMTEVYEVEDDYAINAGGYMTTAPWFFDTFWVERVVIEDGVSPVSTDHWFDYFSELTSVTFPASITNVGYYIFHACDNLREIWFKGDAPTFSEWAFDYSYDTITAYYPAGNATWTEVITRDFAYDVIWVPYDAGDLEENVIDFGVCGDNLTWKLTDDGVLTISGTGDMYDYTYEAGAPWLSYADSIHELVIDDAVTSIGKYAFYNCYYMYNASIPNGLTTIGGFAFSGCTRLTSIVIPDSVTSIGKSAFHNCKSLESVSLSNSLTYIEEGVFGNCRRLTSITIPNGVTVIGYSAFDGCYGLVSVTIPSSVTEINGSAFSECSSLTSVMIPDSVTWIGYGAFEDCTSLVSVIISNGVTSIGYDVFRGCSSLTSVTIPQSVTSIEECAFCGCSSLVSITIPDSVTSIGNYVFSNCSSLESIVIPNSVTSIGDGAFSECTSLTEFTLSSSMTAIVDAMFVGCTSLVHITIPDSVTGIGDSAFAGCTGLSTIVIPDTVTYIGRGAFYNCTNLWHVLYEGTEEQWKNIWITFNNDLLDEAIHHYECDGTEVTDPVKKECTLCNCNHVWDDGVITVVPGCVTDGERRYTCTACGNSYVEAIPAVGHSYGEWYVVTEPTEYADGEERRDCSVCGCFETRPISMVEHVHSYEGVVTAPTCTESGYTTYVCSCGESYISDSVDPLGHAFGEWEVVKAPTCTEHGEEKRSCTRCDFYETQTVLMVDHDYTPVVTAPTCTLSGYTTYVCVCGESYISDTVDPLGHAFGEWEVVKAPTCTEHGEEKRSCTRCDFYETQVVQMVGHEYTPVVTAPTCTESGYTTYVCICGESYISDTVDPLGHAFGEWEVVKAPACTEHGEEKRSCTRCDFYETQVVQMVGHEYSPVVTAPTCTEPGNTTYVCRCGESYIGDVSPALGHAFGEWEVVKAPTCTEQGQEKRTCTRCDYSETQTMQTAEHEYTAVVTDPTCLTKGYTTYTCHCGASYISDVLPALGHNFSEWEVVQEPTQSEAGMEIRTCLRCGTTETHSIPALGTGKYAEGTLAFCADGIAYLYGADGVIKETFTGWMTDTYEMASTPSGEMIITTPWYAYRFEITYVNIESGVSPASTNRWFFGFTNLISAVIGDGVTSIGDDAFFGCEKLPQIIIPSNVTSIGSFAFSRAASLTEIIFEGDAPEIGEYAFHEVAATAKYPAWNTTWTGAVKQSYMGNLTWYGYWVDSMGDLAPKCVNGHLCLEMVTEPTCSNSGYTTYICPDCGDSYVSNYVDALGHTLGEWTMIKGPTCAQEGEEVATCIWCGHQESRAVEKLEHNYKVVVTEPTCTEGGYHSHICVNCGASYTTDHVEPAGHAWDDGVVTKEPTTEAEGEKTYTCTVCGETRVETIAKKADVVYDVPEDNSVTIPENDCFEAGTIVTVDVIEDGERFELVTQIMETVTNQYVAFEFSASRDDVPVQPNGKLTVTIHIPKGFSNNVCVYYMDENGQLTTLETVVDEQNRTVTVDIPHFSTYILADQGAAPDGLLGDVNGDGKINSRDARALLRYIAGLVGEGEIDTTVADYNGDGKINSRDARALLRSIAGLEG